MERRRSKRDGGLVLGPAKEIERGLGISVSVFISSETRGRFDVGCFKSGFCGLGEGTGEFIGDGCRDMGLKGLPRIAQIRDKDLQFSTENEGTLLDLHITGVIGSESVYPTQLPAWPGH